MWSIQYYYSHCFIIVFIVNLTIFMVGYVPVSIDDFRNDVINRQEYYVIPDMLAKGVGRSVSIIANEQRMDSARAILQLQASASEEKLLATLQRLTVQRLKFLCKESAVKSSGIKAEIIGRFIVF